MTLAELCVYPKAGRWHWSLYVPKQHTTDSEKGYRCQADAARGGRKAAEELGLEVGPQRVLGLRKA